jgi:hypothetical protein
MKLFSLIAFFGLSWAMLVFSGCGKSIGVVDAGTYPGTIDKVVPEEEEIYVTLDSGERLELYFTEETELIKGGEAVEFSSLKADADVEVTVAREGNRNTPVKVELQ